MQILIDDDEEDSINVIVWDIEIYSHNLFVIYE